ncbi:MAG: hypothetical protein LBB55_05090 [Zoogloeaceae bacterium]|jgi:hypothetical protein|nr:hypothetical protein [Zoogloeaceae bacterium]
MAGWIAVHGYGHGKRLLGYMIEEVIQEIGFAIVNTEPDVFPQMDTIFRFAVVSQEK